METPFTTVPDPQVKLIQDCTSAGCTYRMGPPRVHQGSNHPEHRGAIVQSCTNRACNRTVPLTQRYIMQDADALLIRINARAKNLTISPADNVPLRLAPRVEVPDAVGGKMKCATPDCASQGAKTCIEYLCKKCCLAAVAAVRDPCGYHRRAAICDNPPPLPLATRSAPAARNPRRGRNNGSTSAQAAPLFEPVNRGRALAQPIGPNWRAQTHENIAHATAQNAKVLRLDLEEVEKKKVAFALYFAKGNPAVDMKEPVPTYPLFTLSLLPGLMTDLQLTESSRYQFWDYNARKWVFTVASTGISVDRARTTIIRFPATIRDVWTDNDCPGLDEWLESSILIRCRTISAGRSTRQDRSCICKTAIPYNLLLCEVLLPETVMRLVQDDLAITDIAAKSIMQASHDFGLVLHPSCDHPDIEEVDRYLAKHRSTPAYRLADSSESESGGG
ncbi:hypothetical protein GGX14DRAFT_405116 [Mycena pura]|uniref:Restriction of telomere capping protein 4 C-terminal domain-containing protein n=1 Tax=Mycena pura TaxID=153505 RepID=A0AAD6Y4N2_9AGAR|nr:hypothetical protein GGX14DRAFT_405116 [Mycena pura]